MFGHAQVPSVLLWTMVFLSIFGVVFIGIVIQWYFTDYRPDAKRRRDVEAGKHRS